MSPIMDASRRALLSELTTAGTGMLTTFRRSGQGVPTPVSIAVDGDHVYFATASDSGKAKRLASDDAVTLAPCTPSGKVTGRAVVGRARTYEPAHRSQRWRLLRPTRSIVWSLLLYRMRGKKVRLYEVTPEAWLQRGPTLGTPG